MAVDFSKIFSQNSPSTPFTWTDAEYLQGWDVIQNTPPTRQQFNALQKISDEKDLELYNTKAPKHSPVFTGDPQAPTPAWNDNDKSLATTAFVKHWVDVLGDELDENGVGIVAGSTTGSGYVKFKNGFMIQWGGVITSDSGPVTGTFPIAFPTTCLCVLCGSDEAGGAPGVADDYCLLLASPKNASQFYAVSTDLINLRYVQNGMAFMAIGY